MSASSFSALPQAVRVRCSLDAVPWHVDVLAARTVSTADGLVVAFDDLWDRRQTLRLDSETPITIPSLADLILTKRFGQRPKDLEDIRLLQTLLAEEPTS